MKAFLSQKLYDNNAEYGQCKKCRINVEMSLLKKKRDIGATIRSILSKIGVK